MSSTTTVSAVSGLSNKDTESAAFAGARCSIRGICAGIKFPSTDLHLRSPGEGGARAWQRSARSIRWVRNAGNQVADGRGCQGFARSRSQGCLVAAPNPGSEDLRFVRRKFVRAQVAASKPPRFALSSVQVALRRVGLLAPVAKSRRECLNSSNAFSHQFFLT